MTDATVKNCSNCGAELRFAPGTLNLKCTHCGTENAIEVALPAAPTSVPDYIVPLGVDEKALRRTVQTYLAEGSMVPDDILDAAEFTKMELFYVPAYLFHGNYTATWTASFGYDRQEHYTDYENRYDHNLKRDVRVAVAKTKTVTDWRPVNGSDSGSFNFPAYGGGPQPPSVVGLIDGMSWSDGKPFDASFLAGFRAEDFGKSADQVFNETGNARVNAVIDAGVKTHAQGDRQRDWNWKANFNHAVTSYFVPLGWARYSYGGQEYNYWLDGIAGGRFVADQPPADKKRKLNLFLGYVPALAGFALVAMMPNGSATAAGVAMFAALAWGGVRHYAILHHSKSRRAATLARKIAEEGDRHELSERQEKALQTAYSDVKPNLLANTSHDRKLIPAIIAGMLVVSLAQPGWNSLQESRQQAAAERAAAERRAQYERREAEMRAERERQAAARRAQEEEAARQAAEERERQAREAPPSAPAQVAAAPSVAEKATTIEKGNPDRKVLLDRIRPMVEKLLNPPVNFEVDAIRRAGEYAYLRVTPVRPSGESINVQQTNLRDKNSGVLTQIVLKLEGSEWKLVGGAIGTKPDWAAAYCGPPYPRDLTGTCN